MSKYIEVTSVDNFSHRIIRDNDELIIPEDQQMVLCGCLEIEASACLSFDDNAQLAILR